MPPYNKARRCSFLSLFFWKIIKAFCFGILLISDFKGTPLLSQFIFSCYSALVLGRTSLASCGGNSDVLAVSIRSHTHPFFFFWSYCLQQSPVSECDLGRRRRSEGKFQLSHIQMLQTLKYCSILLRLKLLIHSHSWGRALFRMLFPRRKQKETKKKSKTSVSNSLNNLWWAFFQTLYFFSQRPVLLNLLISLF